MYIRYNEKLKTFEFPAYSNGALIDSIHNTLVWNPKEEDYINAGYQVVADKEPLPEKEGFMVGIRYSINKKGIISYEYYYIPIPDEDPTPEPVELS